MITESSFGLQFCDSGEYDIRYSFTRTYGISQFNSKSGLNTYSERSFIPISFPTQPLRQALCSKFYAFAKFI